MCEKKLKIEKNIQVKEKKQGRNVWKKEKEKEIKCQNKQSLKKKSECEKKIKRRKWDQVEQRFRKIRELECRKSETML